MINENNVVDSSNIGPVSTKQSAEKTMTASVAIANVPIAEKKHETVMFSQESTAMGVSIKTQMDETFKDGGMDTEAGLGEFLSRPVQLDLGGAFKSFLWVVGAGGVGTYLINIDPWRLWQANAKVKQKLSNFAYLRGTLKVRWMIAGTPFHYGRVLISYLPFGTANDIDSQALGYMNPEGYLMYSSMKMCTELDPTTSTPVEMTLPYVNPWNWLSIPAAESLGTLQLLEMVPLSRANDTAVTTIAVTAFAWMENVELCVPTLAVPTSGKEQPTQSSISGMASAVAAAAGAISKVPVIGPYAKATQIASSGVSDIAKMFGMSRPTDASKPTQVKFVSESSMAFLQGASLAQKLTLDPQQELCVDPNTVGLGSGDEMTFESIVNRECFLTVVTWTDAGGTFLTSGASVPANIGALLFACNVTPNLCKRTQTRVGTFGTYQISQPTPSMMVARAFNFWRGTMVFRFRVIASSFHRGYLRVNYDPLTATQPLDTNSQMTHVLDISEARELVVRVPWCSKSPYLEVASQKYEPLENYSPALFNGTINYAYNNFDVTKHNGCLTAVIVNTLVAPNAQPAYIIVSSWMEDCEFQSPSNRIFNDFPIFAAPTSGADDAVVLAKGNLSEGMSQVCFGERCFSARSLMKRSSLSYVLMPNSTVASAVSWTSTITLPAFPLATWADQDLAVRCIQVSYLTYFASAFNMRRGGVRYVVVWDDGTVASRASPPTVQFTTTAQYTRSWDAVCPGTAGSVNPYYTLDQVKTTQDTVTRPNIIKRNYSGYEGLYVVNHATGERVHEIEIPSYSATRFTYAGFCPIQNWVTDNTQFTLQQNPSEVGFQCWKGNVRTYGSQAFTANVYSAAAEDLAFFWFQAVPPLYTLVGT
jgi:hypothetical protein